MLLSRYPLTHELFKENLGADYAGCGALWREAQPGALTPRAAQEQFNALWKARIKLVKPKEQPKAVEALRLTLVAQAQEQHNKADEALVAELPRILVHERAALLAMLPGPSRDEHQRRLDVPEVVCAAWAQLPVCVWQSECARHGSSSPKRPDGLPELLPKGGGASNIAG